MEGEPITHSSLRVRSKLQGRSKTMRVNVTRTENEGLDALKEPNAFPTVPVEPIPGGPRPRGLEFDVLRIVVLDVGG